MSSAAAEATLVSNVNIRNHATKWFEQLAQQGVMRWSGAENNISLLLATLLDAQGWQGDILSLCDALPVSAHRVGVQDILTVMGALGFRIQHERIHTKNLKAEDLPALFIPTKPHGWRQGMVLQEINAYGLIWDDGRERHRGNLPVGDGDLYRFERISTDNDDDEMKEKQSWLLQLRERFRPLLWQACALSLIMHLFTLAMPIFSMVVYDRVIAAHAPGTLPLLATGVIFALGVEHMIRWMRVRIAGWIGARSGLIATAAMFERLLFLPASIIEQASVSSQLARIRAFESIRDFITGPVFLNTLEIPFLAVLILIIAMLAGPVAWVAVSIVVVQILIMLLLKTQWRKLGRETAHAAAQRQQLLMDITEKLKAIYAAGMSQKMLQRFKSVSWQAAKTHYRFSLNTVIVQHVASLLTVIAGVGTIVWSLNRIWAGEMTGGAMVATMIITWRVLYPLQALCSVLPNLEQIRGSLEQVAQLMSFTPEAHAAHVVLAEHPLKGKISIQNLGLRYGRKSDPVFVGLSAEIEAGEIVVLYGGNGSGKSSLLRMLLGLYAPAIGSIRLDGVDHRQFDPRSLRRQIAYLSQQPELLPGSIAENLRVHDPLAPEYRIRQALLWADAWEIVEQLPAGLNTRLGENAYIPSSGFAARLCLARLYLADRPLILCDELPNQLLNSATGERFRRYLEESRGKRTVLYVTHREDWVQFADKVIWFKPDSRPIVANPKQSVQSTE